MSRFISYQCILSIQQMILNIPTEHTEIKWRKWDSKQMSSAVVTRLANKCTLRRVGAASSSPWLWSSSPPPVTPLTITLSELFLWLCGKMAGRKCVYTVILLSVCVQVDLDRNFFSSPPPLGTFSSIFFFSKHFYFVPPPPTFFFSLSPPPFPLFLFHDQWQKRETGSLQW